MPSSESVARLKELARQYFDDDQVAAAILLYRAVGRLAPEDAFAQTILGDLLRVLGRWREAEAVLMHAHDIAPIEHRPTVAGCLAFLYSEHDEWEKAETWFQTTLADPKRAQESWWWIFRGSNLAKMERFAEAESHFHRAASLKDNALDEAYLNIGLMRRALEDFDRARLFAEKALAVDPDYSEAQKLLHSLKGVEDARIMLSSLDS